jgi:16S rRNA (guanine966-N2)-methyltransferase
MFLIINDFTEIGSKNPMRIITGRARGLKLTPPKNYDVRPTADRVKEALFNIIRDYVPGAVVLDAFAGTGNLALEAWSRGAKKIILFDKSNESLRLVRTNVKKARAEEAADIRHTDAIAGVAKAAARGETFDLIFSDPPYDKGLNQKLYEALCEHPILRSGGMLVLEHSLNEDPASYVKPGTQIRTEKYGDTKISLIMWK